MFNRLPKALKIKIYQYDMTYHNIYKTVLIEFLEKTSFWRIKWLNKTMDYSRENDDPSIYKYDSKKSNIKSIVNYWNNEYSKVTFLNLWKTKNNCTDCFITDEERKGSQVILRRLKLLKNYKYDINRNKLYKPSSI